MERERSILEDIAAEHEAFLAILEHLENAILVCSSKDLPLQILRKAKRRFDIQPLED